MEGQGSGTHLFLLTTLPHHGLFPPDETEPGSPGGSGVPLRDEAELRRPAELIPSLARNTQQISTDASTWRAKHEPSSHMTNHFDYRRSVRGAGGGLFLANYTIPHQQSAICSHT